MEGQESYETSPGRFWLPFVPAIGAVEGDQGLMRAESKLRQALARAVAGKCNLV